MTKYNTSQEVSENRKAVLRTTAGRVEEIGKMNDRRRDALASRNWRALLVLSQEYFDKRMFRTALDVREESDRMR